MDFWRGRSRAKIQKFVIRAAVMFLLYILDSSFKQLKTFEAFQKKNLLFLLPEKKKSQGKLKIQKGLEGHNSRTPAVKIARHANSRFLSSVAISAQNGTCQ